MTGVVGGRLEDCSRTTVAGRVREFVATYRGSFARTDTVVVVPDAFYPHHESTGLVTNLDVVESLCAEVAALVDDVVVVPAVAEDTARGTVPELLGYGDLDAGSNVSVRAAADCRSVDQTVGLADGAADTKRATVTLPRPLVDHPVVPVPTLRNSPGDVHAGTMRTLELLADHPADDDPDRRWRYAAAVHDHVDPHFAVLDGTYAYAGRPHRARFLAAGTDLVALDGLGAFLLDLDRGDCPALRDRGWDGGYQYVEGFSTDALRQELPNERPPAPDEEGLMEKGYRLYARLSGDALPPQVLSEGSQ
jgi:uncharacterized protein (DUF362 family)